MRVRYMIRALCLLCAPLALFGARVVPLPTLPCGELPNSFSLELNASASNSLSIAVGTAAGDTRSLPSAYGSSRPENAARGD